MSRWTGGGPRQGVETGADRGAAGGAGALLLEPRLQAVEVEDVAAGQALPDDHFLAADDAGAVGFVEFGRGDVRESFCVWAEFSVIFLCRKFINFDKFGWVSLRRFKIVAIVMNWGFLLIFFFKNAKFYFG